MTRNQDIVHRAVGRPGVVLVGEGTSPTRVTALLIAEKKKVARFVPDVPIYDLQAGNEDGQVPLRKLNNHLMKLPRNLKTAPGHRGQPAPQGARHDEPADPQGPDAAQRADAARPARLTVRFIRLVGPRRPV